MRLLQFIIFPYPLCSIFSITGPYIFLQFVCVNCAQFWIVLPSVLYYCADKTWPNGKCIVSLGVIKGEGAYSDTNGTIPSLRRLSRRYSRHPRRGVSKHKDADLYINRLHGVSVCYTGYMFLLCHMFLEHSPNSQVDECRQFRCVSMISFLCFIFDTVSVVWCLYIICYNIFRFSWISVFSCF